MGEEKKFQFDFSMFILSLATSVQVQLGLLEDPNTKQKSVNLPAAAQTIDILEMLKEKTKNNLTEQEDKLFEHVMFELRMRYVEAKNKGGKV